jgi:hypothetical protein
MSARRRFTGDSLDLLLDTVCSMFGAITLIAILVALLARTSQSGNGAMEIAEELLQRKIVMAESDIAATRRLREKTIQPGSESVMSDLSQKQQLTDALEKAKIERENAGAELASQVAVQNVDFSAEWKKQTAELVGMERAQTEASNLIATLEQNTQRLRVRADAIEKQIKDDQQTRKLTLRFPKEQAKTKKTFSMICRFGKVYPIYDRAMKLNEHSIAWQTVGKSRISKPIQSLGWRPEVDRAAIERSMQTVKASEYYVTYFVYPDSIGTFRTIRDWALAAGYEVGFELERTDATISWGEDGTMPPPL